MGNPVTELQKIFRAGSSQETMNVVSVNNGMVTVRGRNGVRSIPSGGLDVRPGESVIVQGQTIMGARPNLSETPTYNV